MSSRLDRLFLLLDSGGSSVTRRAAAQQLGQVVRLHPCDLESLLEKLHQYIVSKSWETRIAAGQAVEAIVLNLPKWDPIPKEKEENADSKMLNEQLGHLSLETFSIQKVLQYGSYLLGADEKQFDNDEAILKMDPKERAMKQRLIVNQSLGLDMAEALGIDTQAIVSNCDLMDIPSVKPTQVKPEESVAQIVNTEMVSAGMALSSRKLNRAKRKAKTVMKQKSIDSPEVLLEDEPEKKKFRRSSQDEDMEIKSVSEYSDATTEQSEEWPLEEFCEQLCLDLFSCTWETRHGAATALREIIRLHGDAAGKSANQNQYQMISCHERWLEDKAVRLVCVLALDKFGDFLADQVVAPVRETCAQVLGGILKHVSEKVAFEILILLQEMLMWSEWGTRHGGLLGLKYLLAVRSDIRTNLLLQTYSHIYKGLKDEMDDVVAVAATCLVPVADDLIKCFPFDVINQLLSTLWESLFDIDDLTVSTNSILLLISKLLGHRQILENITGNLESLVPRLFPFLYHSSTAVRNSTLNAIYTLTQHYQTVSSSDDSENLVIDQAPQVTMTWLEMILQSLLFHIFQRALFENNEDNRLSLIKIWDNLLKKIPLSKVLVVTCPAVPSWLCLVMSSPKMPLDSNLLVIPRHKSGDGLKKSGRRGELGEALDKYQVKCYIGGSERETKEQIIKARCLAAKLLGNLSYYISQPMPDVEYKPEETPILCFIRLLLTPLRSRSALQRLGAGLVIREWAYQHRSHCHEDLKEVLVTSLSEMVCFDELAWSLTKIQQETKDFIAMMKHYNVEIDESFRTGSFLSLDQIQELCGKVTVGVFTAAKLRKKVYELLNGRRQDILSNAMQASGDQEKLSIMIQAILSGALVRFRSLPEKLNPVIKPLMESVKKEENLDLQKMAASDLAFLLELCLERVPSPNAKVLKNLSTFLCVDSDFTPDVIESKSNMFWDGIWTTMMQQRASNIKLLKRSSSCGSRGPGRPPSKPPIINTDVPEEIIQETQIDVELKKKREIQRRGCTLALTSICQYFGEHLFDKLPSFIDLLFEPLDKNSSIEEWTTDVVQKYINWLQLLEVVMPYLHESVLKKFEEKLSCFEYWLYSPISAIRHMAGRALATLSSVLTVPVMSHVINHILPGLNNLSECHKRQGIIEFIYTAIEKLGFNIVPYIVLLIVPLLGCMSDPDSSVRTLSTQCFATLIRLFPLEAGSESESHNLPSSLVERKQKERYFIDQLVDPKKIENYTMPIPIKAELRQYQQQGLNWLSFLNRYKLHGVLCDDMGLGKTLQSLCILAADHYTKEAQVKELKVPISKTTYPCSTGIQSIVICPPTLTGHWCYEINKFVSEEYLNPLHYAGPPMERRRLRAYFFDYNVIVASYKIVRNEIDFFSKIKWNYIILDEGHIIKNGKTKSSRAIKELIGNHRLILSGTPIQNNVLELWSLFDFLMPGYLGTERQFSTKYSRPILQSREAKSSSKEQEAGVLAMESLHRQTLPFLLRRVKEDVLTDLPPKITQDYYCELSPLQQKLYEDFARSKGCQDIDKSLGNGYEDDKQKQKAQGHIFQALQYLRRVCNHPKLVLQPNHPQYTEVLKEIKESNIPLSDISHSAKLPAFKQLLLDCGIGCEESGSDMTANAVVSPHRALVFCQLKGMLDIIEHDLLRVHLPSVTYLRLDGSVPANARHNLVQTFNSDPSIDLLLLTTQVGGLGLNLTGADTVIFVEHDWNPMKDLQAMDRAHRIGQKRVVNVYRLITKGTLEEKIMSLQKMKLLTARSVISEENACLKSMGTDQLLDLFDFDKTNGPARDGRCASTSNTQTQSSKGIGMKEVLENLPELWDESQYDQEYDLQSFLDAWKK